MRRYLLQYPLLFLIVFGSLFTACDSKETWKVEPNTTYYLIRHAEKDRSDASETDPVLTDAGMDRAALWADFFNTIPLDQVYSTDYKRTRQTVQYVANIAQLPIQSYDPNTLINQAFFDKTAGQSVLICGHSDTTPMLVNQMIGEEKYPKMEDSDNTSLYVVTFKDGEAIVEVQKVDWDFYQ